MTAWWRIEITIDSTSWVIEEPDLAVEPGDPLPLSGMNFGWSMPDSTYYPIQPDPMDAAFNLLVADMVDVATMDIGSTVDIAVTVDPSGPTVFEFHGKITDLDSRPHDRGAIVGILAMDTTNDERPVGAVAWPAENLDERIARIFAEAGYPLPDYQVTWSAFYDVDLRDAAVGPWPAELHPILNSLVSTVSTDIIDNTARGSARAILAPVVPGGTAANFYTFDEIPQRTVEALPGHFGNTPDGYGVVLDVDPAAGIIGAGKISRSARWVRRRFGSLNHMTVSSPYGIDQYPDVLPDPLVTAQIECPFHQSGLTVSAQIMWYVDGMNGADRWQAEEFRWLLSKDLADPAGLDPADLTPGWFPVHSAPENDPIRGYCYRRLVGVTDIEAGRAPSGADWYAGQLKSARLTVEKGDLVVDFTLRNTYPIPILGGSGPDAEPAQLTWAGLAASADSAVTWDQLVPASNWYDYRLLTEA